MLYDNIMVPYDGSESAQAALAEAVRYAREDPGAALHIVQIVDTEQREQPRSARGRRARAHREAARGAVAGLRPDRMRQDTGRWRKPGR